MQEYKHKHIISFSGGLGSFATAYRVIQKSGAADVRLLFADTKTEDEDLYRFITETVNFLGAKFDRIADGRNIWGIFTAERYMGNSRVDPCSRILKRELIRRWMEENYPNPEPEGCILYVGIGWDEINRMKNIQKRWQPYTVEAPLLEKPYWGTADIIKLLERINIAPPRLYKLGFAHNNCGGFCIKAGQAQFKRLLLHFLERYKWHEEQQEKLFQIIGKRPFISKMQDGIKTYLSLKEFREQLESGNPIDELDFGGCGCVT